MSTKYKTTETYFITIAESENYYFSSARNHSDLDSAL
jgi:hypothetical protein